MIHSPKYAMLYPPLIQRIWDEEAGKKDQEKRVKTRLHQMFGAYVQGNAHKKAQALLNQLEDKKTIDPAALLALHASTKERMAYIQDFWEFILPDGPLSVLDLGCGFNPFSILYLKDHIKDQGKITSYHAHDIDIRTQHLLNQFFSWYGLPTTAACMDLIATTPTTSVDLTLMCKLLPVLEAQAPGRGFQLANGLNTTYLVITYPLKSLGGRNKGMGTHYRESFQHALNTGKLSHFSLSKEEEVGDELIYLLKRIP